MSDTIRDKLLKAKEAGILTEKEYLKKIKALDIPKVSEEVFSWKKVAKGMFSLFDPVEWAQTLREVGITDVRKWIIFAMLLGSIYGYGYLKGVKNKPVHLDMHGKEVHIDINDHKLHILPDGSAQVEDHQGNVLKTIKVSDIPELKKALKPIGFYIKPFVTAGYGVSTDGESGTEAGLGTSIYKFYRLNFNSWLTNRGIYLGTGYQITENFDALLGGGKGYEGDTRVYLGGKWKF